MQLLCPKCNNLMAQYERNRVLVDQCTECKGIFLDRGEFEHLVEAEKAYYGSPTPVARPAMGDRYDHRAYDDRRYDDRPYDSHRGDHRSDKKRRRSSMLEELFDF
jgi:Zn-finger nucleic acid-binding protein